MQVAPSAKVTFNGHPCPPRLLALVALAREADVACDYDEGQTHAGTVLAPGHVVTGALSRGPMLGCVALQVDQEAALMRQRSEVAKRCLQMRPDHVPYEDWAELLARHLVKCSTLTEVEARMAAEAEAARCSTSI